MLLAIILATGGLTFAFEHSTIAGKIVLALLAVVSIFSWSIMITKLRVIQFARKQTARFRGAFRKDRQPLRLFENHAKFPGAPLFNVYRPAAKRWRFNFSGPPKWTRRFARASMAPTRLRPRKCTRSTPRWNAPSAKPRLVWNRK